MIYIILCAPESSSKLLRRLSKAVQMLLRTFRKHYFVLYKEDINSSICVAQDAV